VISIYLDEAKESYGKLWKVTSTQDNSRKLKNWFLQSLQYTT